MRLKRVPAPPESLSAVTAYQRAIPLVPGSVDDCCRRLVRRCACATRQDAADWLAFLNAFGLVRETERGVVRADVEPTQARLQITLRETILHVPATLRLLADASRAHPVTAADVFEATRDAVPRHDRARDTDWEATWRARAGRLLRWLVLADLAAPVDETDPQGYVAGPALDTVLATTR